MNKKENDFSGLFVFILLIAAIIWLAVTFGNTDLINEEKTAKSDAERRRLTLERYGKLCQLIDKKKELKKRLDRKMKWVYLAVRLFFLVMYGAFNVAIVSLFHINLSTMVSWNKIVWSCLGLLNLVFLGAELSLKNGIDLLHIEVQNLVYGKYVTIADQIEEHNTERKGLANALKTLPLEPIVLPQ